VRSNGEKKEASGAIKGSGGVGGLQKGGAWQCLIKKRGVAGGEVSLIEGATRGRWRSESGEGKKELEGERKREGGEKRE